VDESATHFARRDGGGRDGDAGPESEGFMSFMFVQPDPNVITVVERVSENPHPEYLPYAKTRCLRCDEWCWLGDQSFKVVSGGKAMPVCQQCARELVPAAGFVAFDYLTNALREDHE
jgi:hypothetical protein